MSDLGSCRGRPSQRLLPATCVALLVGGAVACGHSAGSPSGRASDTLPAAAQSAASTQATTAATGLPVGVLAAIHLPLGGAPAAVAAGFGSIWVTTHRGTVLYRIDPNTDRVTAQIDVGQESCSLMAIGAARVWTLPCASGNTIVVNPATNQIDRTLPPAALSIAFANGRPWLTSRVNDPLTELDPVTFRITATLKVANTVIFAGAGKIFTANPSPLTGEWNGSTITEIDPDTHRVLRTFTTPDPGTYASVIYAFGRIWLKGSDTDKLIAIEPGSGVATTYTIPGWSALDQFYGMDITTGLGDLWIRTANGTVSRIEPRDAKVIATYPADPAAGGGDIVVDNGSLWIANFGTDTVWRDRITS